MSSTEINADLLARLQICGDPRTQRNFMDGRPNYVAKLGVTEDDVPMLLDIAEEWAAIVEVDYLEDDTTQFAAIHAWRTIGQLRAASAIEPLIDLMRELNALDDDWGTDELPRVFGMIGQPALVPMIRLAAMPFEALYVRTAASSALAFIAQQYPEMRGEVVRALSQLLDGLKNEPDKSAYATCELAGFIVGDLCDLEAKEAGPVIERAFARDGVDESICGDWSDVQKTLAVADAAGPNADAGDDVAYKNPQELAQSIRQLKQQNRDLSKEIKDMARARKAIDDKADAVRKQLLKRVKRQGKRKR